MHMNKNLSFFWIMILASPSIVLAQGDPSFPRGVTLQVSAKAHNIEVGLELIRQSIITDRQLLTAVTKTGDKPRIKVAKVQLAQDWHDYRVQRSRLNKLTGVDYQKFDFSKHEPPAEDPPPIITLQELIDKQNIEDQLKVIKQSIITDRQSLDAVTLTGDELKIKAVQDVLAKDFSEYKAKKLELKTLEAQMDPSMAGSKKNGHKHPKKV
jgi:hypothetical protein